MQVDNGQSSDEDSHSPPPTTRFEYYFQLKNPNGLGVDRSGAPFNGLIPAQEAFEDWIAFAGGRTRNNRHHQVAFYEASWYVIISQGFLGSVHEIRRSLPSGQLRNSEDHAA